MAESELQEIFRDRGKNVQFAQDKQDIVTSNLKGNVEQMSEIQTVNMSTTKDTDNNDIKAKCTEGDSSHVHNRNDNKPQTATNAVTNIEKSPGGQPSVDNKPDALVSPETPTKRRRVHHDYRRLSSAGYVDDYEKSGKERFTQSNEKEFELLEKEMNAVTSPTQPKPKVIARPIPKTPSITEENSNDKIEGLS